MAYFELKQLFLRLTTLVRLLFAILFAFSLVGCSTPSVKEDVAATKLSSNLLQEKFSNGCKIVEENFRTCVWHREDGAVFSKKGKSLERLSSWSIEDEKYCAHLSENKYCFYILDIGGGLFNSRDGIHPVGEKFELKKVPAALKNHWNEQLNRGESIAVVDEVYKRSAPQKKVAGGLIAKEKNGGGFTAGLSTVLGAASSTLSVVAPAYSAVEAAKQGKSVPISGCQDGLTISCSDIEAMTARLAVKERNDAIKRQAAAAEASRTAYESRLAKQAERERVATLKEEAEEKRADEIARIAEERKREFNKKYNQMGFVTKLVKLSTGRPQKAEGRDIGLYSENDNTLMASVSVRTPVMFDKKRNSAIANISIKNHLPCKIRGNVYFLHGKQPMSAFLDGEYIAANSTLNFDIKMRLPDINSRTDYGFRATASVAGICKPAT